MDDHLAHRAARQMMGFAPRVVVVVFDVEAHLDAERPRDRLMYERVIGRGVACGSRWAD